MFGVAPTAAAAEVLATETGASTDTLDKLLYEHRQPEREPGPGYDLPSGATVILDEAGTVSTPNLAQLIDLADQHYWRVVMVGDPHQFTAVGRGGCSPISSTPTGRSSSTASTASPTPGNGTLRCGSAPGTRRCLPSTSDDGRLHGGTLEDMETDILTAWATARARGEAVAMMANTTDTVDRLNRHAQQARISIGDLDPTGPHLTVGGQQLLVGDEVVTRRNDRTVHTERRVIVKNRDHWTIDTIHPDRSVTVTGPNRHRPASRRLPTRHLQLGYAQTATPPKAAPSTPASSSSTDHRQPRRVHAHDPRPGRQPRLRRRRGQPNSGRRSRPSGQPGVDRPTRRRPDRARTGLAEARSTHRWPSLRQDLEPSAEDGRGQMQTEDNVDMVGYRPGVPNRALDSDHALGR